MCSSISIQNRQRSIGERLQVASCRKAGIPHENGLALAAARADVFDQRAKQGVGAKGCDEPWENRRCDHVDHDGVGGKRRRDGHHVDRLRQRRLGDIDVATEDPPQFLEAIGADRERCDPDDACWSGQTGSPPVWSWRTVPGDIVGRRLVDMSSEGASRGVATDIPLDRRPWAQLSTDQLLDRLEWSYSDSGGFEPEVVWELARRATQATGAS